VAGVNGGGRGKWGRVDRLNVAARLGVGALARRREFDKVRPGFDPEPGQAV